MYLKLKLQGIFGLRKTVDFLKDYHTNLSNTDFMNVN